MTTVSFSGLLVVALIAVGAPILVAALRLRIPAPVLEIVAGILVGPSVLSWVEIDTPIRVLSLLGVTFLLFLAGLEIDLQLLRGRTLRTVLLAFLATLAIGVAVGIGADAAGLVRDPLLLAIALSATSLGLVVPVLKDAGQADSAIGRYTIMGATVADFAAVVLLSLLFSESEGGPGSEIFMLATFVVVILTVTMTLGRAGRRMHVDSVLTRLQDTTAEIRVRIAVALLIGFVALAQRVGLEVILGAFIAGAVLNLVDRDSMSHPNFRLKLEAIGYGFLIPVFFVASGIALDLKGVFSSASGIVRIPVFLVALLLVRGVPALLYRRDLGTRGAIAVGLLQATSLPFIVTASTIGVSIGAISAVTGAALVCAGLLSVVIFPALALALLRRNRVPLPSPAATEPAVNASPRNKDSKAMRDRWWQLRWYEFLPELALAVGLGFFLVDQTDAATSAFKSTQAVRMMIVAAILWVVARILIARFVRVKAVGLAIFAMGAVAVLGIVVFPAYDDETIVEAFPAPVSQPSRSPKTPQSLTPSTTSARTATPELVREGQLEGIDHDASGTVAIYRNAGTLVVGLEDFHIQPGPDYDLYVVPGADRDRPDGGARLDDLRGNRGTQFYSAPASVDLDEGPWTVLVWCQTFDVPVANATPA